MTRAAMAGINKLLSVTTKELLFWGASEEFLPLYLNIQTIF